MLEKIVLVIARVVLFVSSIFSLLMTIGTMSLR